MAPRDSSRPRAPHLVIALALVAGVLAASGCTKKMNAPTGAGGGGTTAAATIQIVPNAFNKGMMAFVPDTVTVHVNDVVRLHNGDSILHDIEPLTAGNIAGWGNVSPGQDVDMAPVTATGTFTYVCAIGGHTMIGRVIVAP